MARHETGFEAAADAELGDDDIALIAGHAPAVSPESRAEILARFLTGADGFAAAARVLGGSFGGVGAVKRR